MLLAGDIGGTSTRLGLFTRAPVRPEPVIVREFSTLQFGGLPEIVGHFLRETDATGEPIEAACFGVAGPIQRQVARLTNVPWCVDAAELATRFGLERVWLLNDVAAIGYALPVLRSDELASLKAGVPSPDGNAAVIAPGTGLNETLLHNIGGPFVPVAAEGGHADFAARTSREIELVRELTRLYGRAEYEAVLSGPGLVNIYNFVHQGRCGAVDATLAPAVSPALITAAALARHCAGCVETLEIFVSALGAETGNHALRSMATAGIYIGGGIAPKILPALRAPAFLDAFQNKPPMTDLLAAIPVSVILNPHASLLGAATFAGTLGR